MRLVIDLQGYQSNTNTEIGRFILGFTKALIRNRGRHEIFIALNGLFQSTISPIRAEFNGLLAQENIRVWYAVGPVSHTNTDNNLRRHTAELTREAFLARFKPDLVLISNLFEGADNEGVTSIGSINRAIPSVVLLFDLLPLIYQHSYLEAPGMETWYMNKLNHLHRTNMILAISETLRQEGAQYLNVPPEKFINISMAIDPQIFHPLQDSNEKDEFIQQHQIRAPFVMYVADNAYHKDIESLILAYTKLSRKLRAKHQLLIVSTENSSVVQKLTAKYMLKPSEYVLLDKVSKRELNLLYNLCKVFVFPATHESFSLAILEAMACGKAVIGANTASVREIITLADALFDSQSIAAITKKLSQVLSNPELINKLEDYALTCSQKHSLDRCALDAIKSFENLGQTQTNSIKNNSQRPKLAFLSPLPPARSGISFYSAELLPALNRYYDIDVIVTEEEISDPWINENCKIRTVEWFRSLGNKYYERVLYHFGNSVFHQHMFDLLDEVPGVVVLHDFFLTDIHYYIEVVCGEKSYWTNELYHSHGYKAVQEYFRTDDIRKIVTAYPSNLSILQKSLMIIVHSESSKRLTKMFYGSSDVDNSVVIPMLKNPANEITEEERLKIRQKLNLDKNDFVVCSFGILGPTKQNHSLLKAWLSSTLAGDKNCVLVFVGELTDVDYEQQLQKIISASKTDARIHVTGWVDTQGFKDYLSSADVAVQLRQKSRGETSAAVLDCMNYGIATIVNANGSMADLPDHCVIKLADEFTDNDLVNALEILKTNKNYRLELGNLAREFIKNHHTPEVCAKQYFDVIENCYSNGSSHLSALLQAIMQSHPSQIETETLLGLAQSLDKTITPLYCQRQLFLDISILVQTDLKTGIERVVRSILSEWLQNPPQGFRIEPIYATNTDCYRYARRFTLNFLGCPADTLTDEPIDYHPGDVYLGLDLAHHLVITKSDFYQELRRHGVKVKFLMYDLLPLQLAHAFPKPIDEMHQQWLDIVVQNDGAVCISKTVANDLHNMLAQPSVEQPRLFNISWFHLGADIENSAPTSGVPEKAEQVLGKLKANTTFLMVGTIEPRKGHAQTLAAFEHLWANKDNSILVIIGKQGWMVETFIDKLKNHPELGQRLFWLEGISDEYVAKIYAASTCLIAASEGEGFGLPLIEAAQHKLYIIARDIPVFREVAADHAYYFQGTSSVELARSIEVWLSLYAKDQAPKSEYMPWLTWEESAKQLATIFTGTTKEQVLVEMAID